MGPHATLVRMQKKISTLIFGFITLCQLLSPLGAKERATNPIIWADVPDMGMIRVGSLCK